jgi:rhamnosyltransferase
VRLAHRVSDAASWHFGPLTFLRYSPIRRYWFYKNNVRLIRCKYVPNQWKIRLISIMAIWFIPNLLIDQSPWMSAKMMIKGFFDGWRVAK